MNAELFVTFLAMTFVLVVTPGPIVTLVVATGAREGIVPALVTVVGTTAGNAILVGSIAFGLNWVIQTSSLLFDIIRFGGAAYLIWLGILMWRQAGVTEPPVVAPSSRVHFWRGILVALSNPKTLAFFTAFLPQFVDPTLPAQFQLAVMCGVAVLCAGLIDTAWGIAAGLGRGFFLDRGRQRLLGRASAAMLILGGVWLSLSRRPA